MCSVAESRRRIKRLAALLDKQARAEYRYNRSEPTPMVARGAPVLSRARAVDRLEVRPRTGISDSSCDPMLDAPPFKICVHMHGYIPEYVRSRHAIEAL